MWNFLAQAAPALKDTSLELKKVAEPVFGAATRTSLPEQVARIINGALGLLGILFLGLTLYGGYIWMMARGNEEETKRAKNILEAAIIGLVVILAAFAITQFVVRVVIGSTASGGSGGAECFGGYCFDPFF